MTTKATDILNLFDLPNEIKNITGTFRYRFFDPIEQVDEKCRFVNEDRDVPRYVLIEWKGGEKKLYDLGLNDEDMLVHKKNFFFSSDLSSSYASITSDDQGIEQSQGHVISDNTTDGSRLDYLLTTVNSNEYTEELEKSISSKNKSTKIPVVDPTTNRPIVMTTVVDKEETPDTIIRANNLHSILLSSAKSPLNGGIYDTVIEKSKILDKKFSSRPDPELRRFTSLGDTINKIRNTEEAAFFSISRDLGDDEFLQSWELCGYVVSKYRVTDGRESYMYSRFVADTLYRDPFVAYGQTYRYQLRPVFGKYISNTRSNTGQFIDNTVVFVGSEESAFVDVECTELKVPMSPRNPRFEYVQNSNIRVSWERPESFVFDEGKAFDTDDIKGYQLLVRNSLKEPYQLFRYFTFNNTVPEALRMRSKETITDEYIISSEYPVPDTVSPDDIPRFYEYREYILDIRSNVDYYFALCSIDAHGNSSNYSAQYKVRRNNVTGEVDIQLVCPEGAPKQYPNLLIPGKLVQPSFKASGYKFLDVYFAPDSTVSVPNLKGESVNLQLFELETEIEKNITVEFKVRPNSTK